MYVDNVATYSENFMQLYAVEKLQSFEVQKMGQILCAKKVPFCKSGHI